MTTFPDLSDYRIVLVDDRAEVTAVIAAIFSAASVELTVARAVDTAMHLIWSCRPDVLLVATAIAGGPFAVVEAAQHNGVPVLGLDLGSVGPEISTCLRREYGVAVLRNVDDPAALCQAAKRTADAAFSPR